MLRGSVASSDEPLAALARNDTRIPSRLSRAKRPSLEEAVTGQEWSLLEKLVVWTKCSLKS